jgi:hypothetical protein
MAKRTGRIFAAKQAGLLAYQSGLPPSESSYETELRRHEMNAQPKLSFTNVSADPDVIASIISNGHYDVIGGPDGAGVWWADSISLREWRERQRAAFTDRGEQ